MYEKLVDSVREKAKSWKFSYNSAEGSIDVTLYKARTKDVKKEKPLHKLKHSADLSGMKLLSI
jgi:hypothetical protein